MSGWRAPETDLRQALRRLAEQMATVDWPPGHDCTRSPHCAPSLRIDGAELDEEGRG